MVRILTKKEFLFVEELKALLLKYDAVFTMDGKEGINIIVYEKDGIKDKNEEIRTAIHFDGCFDETELQELLIQSSTLLKRINEEYKRG